LRETEEMRRNGWEREKRKEDMRIVDDGVG
jgi:hypothetical protein